MMNEIIEAIMLLIIFAAVIIVFFMTLWEMMQDGPVTPKWFYKEMKLNWFGSVICFLLLCIASPIFGVCKIIGAVYDIIYHTIKWTFTVGRKKETECQEES